MEDLNEPSGAPLPNISTWSRCFDSTIGISFSYPPQSLILPFTPDLTLPDGHGIRIDFRNETSLQCYRTKAPFEDIVASYGFQKSANADHDARWTGQGDFVSSLDGKLWHGVRCHGTVQVEGGMNDYLISFLVCSTFSGDNLVFCFDNFSYGKATSKHDFTENEFYQVVQSVQVLGTTIRK